MSEQEFLDGLRKSLIDDGEVSVEFMDYIDGRIEEAIQKRTCEIIAANEERLVDELEHKFVRRKNFR